MKEEPAEMETFPGIKMSGCQRSQCKNLSKLALGRKEQENHLGSVQQDEPIMCVLVAGEFGSVLFFSHLQNRKALLRKCYWGKKPPYWLNAKGTAGKDLVCNLWVLGEHRNSIADIQKPGFVSCDWKTSNLMVCVLNNRVQGGTGRWRASQFPSVRWSPWRTPLTKSRRGNSGCLHRVQIQLFLVLLLRKVYWALSAEHGSSLFILIFYMYGSAAKSQGCL